MDNHYLCPYCRGHLRVGDYIVFKIRNTRREKGLLLLHPEFGNYTSIKHPEFYFQEGDRIDFFCPLCMQNLDDTVYENMVHMTMLDNQGVEHEIYFSRVAGDLNTYQVSDGFIQYLDN